MNYKAKLARLEKSKEFWFLLTTCFLFFLLRLPSLFEPYWYGDEGVYEIIGYAIRHGRMLYSQIWDNKPPLLYILYALFDGDQTGAKALSLLFGLLSVIVFYFLAKRLFGKGISTYVATSVFGLLFALPLLEGNIANAENFMLLPIISAALLLQRKNSTTKTLSIVGLLFAFAFLIKIVAVFDLAAFLLFLLLVRYKNVTQTIKQIKMLFPLILAFVTPLILTAFFFLFNHAFTAFVKGAFTQNVGYVGYGNQLLFPQGFLLLKFILLGVGFYVIFRLKKRMSATEKFIYLWLLFSLFNMFFSQRPYTHYMLVGLPSISLLLGLTLWKKAKLRANFLLLIVILLLLVTNFHFYAKTLSYYGNFFSFVTSHKSVEQYRAFFDSHTPGDYNIADYLQANMTAKDTVFLWSNSAQIYRLIGKLPPGRFTVAYHITTNEETLSETDKVLKHSPPTFIVITPVSDYPFTMMQYHEKIVLGNTAIYERTY